VVVVVVTDNFCKHGDESRRLASGMVRREIW
jgi:hypothetical protein